jgi:hypothetical protein
MNKITNKMWKVIQKMIISIIKTMNKKRLILSETKSIRH